MKKIVGLFFYPVEIATFAFARPKTKMLLLLILR